jgi:hypothetical protein
MSEPTELLDVCLAFVRWLEAQGEMVDEQVAEAADVLAGLAALAELRSDEASRTILAPHLPA